MSEYKKNLCDCLAASAELLPERNIIGDSRGWYTRLQFLSLSEHLAAAFTRSGILDGDIVLLKAEMSVASVIALFALRTAGAIVAFEGSAGANTDDAAAFRKELRAKASVEQTSATSFLVTFDSGYTCYFDLFRLQPSKSLPLHQAVSDPAYILPVQAPEGCRYPVFSDADLISEFLRTGGDELSENDTVSLPAHPVPVTEFANICCCAFKGYAVYFQ